MKVEECVDLGGIDPSGMSTGSSPAPPPWWWLCSAFDGPEADGGPHEEAARLDGGIRGHPVGPHGVDQGTRRLDVHLAVCTQDDPAVAGLSEAGPELGAHRTAYPVPRFPDGIGGAESTSTRSAMASTSASLFPIRLYRGTGDTPRRAETLRMLTASRPDSSKISTAGSDDLLGVEVELRCLGHRITAP